MVFHIEPNMVQVLSSRSYNLRLNKKETAEGGEMGGGKGNAAEYRNQINSFQWDSW